MPRALLLTCQQRLPAPSKPCICIRADAKTFRGRPCPFAIALLIARELKFWHPVAYRSVVIEQALKAGDEPAIRVATPTRSIL